MKKQIKLVLTIKIIFSLTILFISCPNLPRYYVALGDSVSSGYGLTLSEESHPSVFFDLIKDDDYVDYYENMAVCGFTTTDLLEFLNNLETEELQILKNAHIITLNIGGNNVLIPFTNYMSRQKIVTGADTVVSGAEEIISGASGIVSNVVDNVISGIGEMMAGVGNILIGTGEIIAGAPKVLSILSGSFSPELKDELEEGVQTFSNEFKSIITWIKKNAPKATIIVNTVYNPIPQRILGASLEISIAVNLLIESINSIIIQESKSMGYLVTDIYPHLSNQLKLMRFYINPFSEEFSFDIIHPNAEGHNLIAQLNYETFIKMHITHLD
ncbi:MAG: GDSL-type esterase/lipase family protein [Treponema sp.]|jgi:lysophospholipase L1-like esterase|nr:GDSL-type esterase/lipase family protein [Treponema sp.]